MRIELSTNKVEVKEARKDVKGLTRYKKEWEIIVESLIGALKDENKYVRWGAAGALGELGDKRAVEPLIEALEDKDRNVREKAAWALVKIGNL
ncbi:MAG: HEAT repeat domain-containing protein [Candidatus Lokiarchaeia archaeon]